MVRVGTKYLSPEAEIDQPGVTGFARSVSVAIGMLLRRDVHVASRSSILVALQRG